MSSAFRFSLISLALGVVSLNAEAQQLSSGVSAPTLLHKVEPEYSEVARANRIEGTVLLSIDVDPSGKAVNLRVLRRLDYGLDEKAIEAVKQWKFKPGYKDGKPVTVQAQIEVNFRLLDEPKSPAPVPAVAPIVLPMHVVWEPKEKCSYCAGRWDDGIFSAGIAIERVTVWASAYRHEKVFAIEVAVNNQAKAPVDVLVDQFSGRLAGQSPIRPMGLPELLALQNPTKRSVAGGILNGIAGLASLGDRKTGTATVQNSDGTTSQVDVYERGTIPIGSERRADEARQRAEVRARAYATSILRNNTVDPGTQKRGFVYFRRDGKASDTMLTLVVRINANTYEFPFVWK